MSNKILNTLNKVSTWYSSYEGLNGFMIKCIYDEFKPWIKGPILEVGAADGYMTNLILKDHEIKSYDIVEGSDEYSKKLKNNFPEINVHNCLLEDYLTDKKYKTIIASHVLEHVENPITFLNKIKQLLDNDGNLLISVPNANSFHRLLGVEMKLIKSPESLNEQDMKIGHYRVYNEQSLKKDLKQAGFKEKIISGSFFKVLSNNQTEELIDKIQWKYYYYLGKKFPKNCADLYGVFTK